jgi:hypothetical protein
MDLRAAVRRSRRQLISGKEMAAARSEHTFSFLTYPFIFVSWKRVMGGGEAAECGPVSAKTIFTCAFLKYISIL